jgi:lysophospholipase L1-like esterase
MNQHFPVKLLQVGRNKDVFKRIIWISLTLNLVAFVFVAKRIYWSCFRRVVETKQQVAPMKYWANRDELFAKLPTDSNDIIFLGNSLTQYFELAELFQNPHVKNRGIAGDKTDGVLDRLGAITKGNPSKVFIEIGVNDLGHKIPTDSILKNYCAVLDTLKRRCPKTNIYIQSVLPVADSSNVLNADYCSAGTNKSIEAINQRLKVIASDKNVTYIDIHSHFQESGHLKPAYTFDGVHLTGDGYLLWTKLLLPYVNSEDAKDKMGNRSANQQKTDLRVVKE